MSKRGTPLRAVPARIEVSVDGGALSGPLDGIGRYLRSLLPRLVAQSTADWRWTVLGRGRESAKPGGPRIDVRRDVLPAGAGRVLSLFTSQPWWLRRLAPDLHWGPAHRLPIGIPQRTACVVTIHDLCWRRAPETMRPVTRVLDARLMPRALQRADRIIAVSRSTERDLIAAFPELAARVTVVHEAAEPLPPAQAMDALAAWGITRPYVLAVGSIEPRKNLRRLLQAFAALPQALRAGTQLVIAGGAGWGNVDLPRLAAELGVAAQLRLLGRVEDAALATLYRHARCLAMPSLYEGFGLPVLEALSHGTPALVGSGSSLEEVAGEAGLSVDPLDVAAISAGLRDLLADDGLRAQLASQARGHAEAFSWERAARETLSVFQDAVARRRQLIGGQRERA